MASCNIAIRSVPHKFSVSFPLICMPGKFGPIEGVGICAVVGFVFVAVTHATLLLVLVLLDLVKFVRSFRSFLEETCSWEYTYERFHLSDYLVCIEGPRIQ